MRKEALQVRWKYHQLVTTSAVLAATGNPFFAFLSGALSPLPDKIDFLCGALGGMPFHLFRHRQHSHYWLYWVLIILYTYPYMWKYGLILTSFSDLVDLGLLAFHGQHELAFQVLLPNLVFWGCVGSLFHIAEDFFSGMGVPLLFPTKMSPHVKIYQGHSFSEVAFSLVLTAGFLYFWFVPSPTRDEIWYLVSLWFN